jgi:hypothetical protein
MLIADLLTRGGPRAERLMDILDKARQRRKASQSQAQE